MAIAPAVARSGLPLFADRLIRAVLRRILGTYQPSHVPGAVPDDPGGAGGYAEN